MTYGQLHDRAHNANKFHRLGETLGIPMAHASGLWMQLYTWALVHAIDGDVTNCTDRELERVAGWTGTPGAFAAAIKSEPHCFIDETKDGRVLHDWWDFAEGIKKAKAERERKHKRRKKEGGKPQVYFARSPVTGLIKIGFSTHVERRLDEHRYTHGHALELLLSLPGSMQTEREWHKRFDHLRANTEAGVEWFEPDAELLQAITEHAGPARVPGGSQAGTRRVPRGVAPIRSDLRGSDQKGEEQSGAERSGAAAARRPDPEPLTLFAPDASDAPSAPPPTAPPVMVFPAQGKVSTWALTEDHLASLQKDYFGIDVRRFLDHMRGKVERGALTSVPTARGYPRAIDNWCAREVRGSSPFQLDARGVRRAPVDRDAEVLASVQAFIAGFDPPAGSARIESEVSDGE